MVKSSARLVFFIATLFFGVIFNSSLVFSDLPTPKEHTSAQEILRLLKEGNRRYAAGKSTHPSNEEMRLIQAGREDQADHAYATVLACSDSRIPVERIFDSGVMDLFVVRTAGNVCGTHEAGSLEYGLLHVHTPVLVVLGHSQCGAVTAATRKTEGGDHASLEHNIPPLLEKIVPAVKRAAAKNPKLNGEAIIPHAIEENVWQSIEDLFRKSPSIYRNYGEGKVLIVGAVYDVGTGRIKWLPQSKVADIHKTVGKK